ncbi:MAG TPA: hypothetical protein VJT31_31380 [Rugosimonospora sp.]|nr:hypothetical protein [Rugosimonospora sp.]
MTTGQVRPAALATESRYAASKVPVVTVLFWVTKILTTGMGETTSDFLAHRLGPVPAVGLSGAGLAVALGAQFAVRRYRAWVYWMAVVMVSVFGTVAADVVHVGFGVPYVVSTVAFATALAAIFALWYRTERTLSIHSIVTRRRELFYWATVLATFALGTAAGDMTATTLHLGYFASGVLFTVVILVPLVAYRANAMNSVLAFWFAYVLTRPVGASFADWLGVPAWRHGLNLGTGPVSLTLFAVILVLVGYLAATRRDEPALS